jgi:hypothetical protein
LSPIVIAVEAGVRLADYVRAEGWDRVLVVADANTHDAPVADPLGAAAREWLGEPASDIVAAVEEKERFVAQRMADDWGALRSQIAPALDRFAAVERALGVAGFPADPGYLEIDETTLRAIFRFATRLRARYTAVDFLEGQGMLGDAIDAMLDASPARRGAGDR